MRRTLILAAAFLTAAALAAAPSYAQQQTDRQHQGPDKAGTPTLGSPGGAAAAQGGVQGDCPAGQVQSANGGCTLGQPGASGGTTSSEMPASPHQQEVLKGQQGGESTPK